MDEIEAKTQSIKEECSEQTSWSAVSKKSTTKYVQLCWLLGGVLVLILTVILSSPTEKAKHPTEKRAGNVIDYTASLSANLEHLKQLQKRHVEPAKMTKKAALPAMLIKQSVDSVARQHAPTTLYTAPKQQADRRDNSMINQPIKAYRLLHPGWTLAVGEVVHAVLETAIHSDFPGNVRAVVSKPAYAYMGSRVIIPAGSRLMGHYAAQIVQGQQRIKIVWDSVLLPKGIMVQLNSPGTDRLGRSGQSADSVNTHFIAHFGQSALLSLIGASVSSVGVHDRAEDNSTSQYRAAVAEAYQQSAGQSLQDKLPIKITLHVHQGAEINVFVMHEISFYDVFVGKGN